MDMPEEADVATLVGQATFDFPGDAPAAGSDPGMVPVCAGLERASGYTPVPAMGPQLPQTPLPMFKVAGVAGIVFTSKPQPIGFPRDDSTFQAVYVKSASDELRLVVCVRLSSAQGYAYSGPIDSQGGQHPVVADLFLANADDDPARDLVVLVAWDAQNALGTSGTLYEPWIFDSPADAGAMQQVVIADPELSFGFDGIREGERVRYPSRDAAAFRTRLQRLE